MKRIILTAVLCVFLGGCGTTPTVLPPVPVPTRCAPPDVLMQKPVRLPQITQKAMSLSDILNLSLLDTGKYNNLLDNDSALIEWVQKNCS
jgi:hypothetical protein